MRRNKKILSMILAVLLRLLITMTVDCFAPVINRIRRKIVNYEVLFHLKQDVRELRFEFVPLRHGTKEDYNDRTRCNGCGYKVFLIEAVGS